VVSKQVFFALPHPALESTTEGIFNTLQDFFLSAHTASIRSLLRACAFYSAGVVPIHYIDDSYSFIGDLFKRKDNSSLTLVGM
jgi:hypothetical protein